ncbi:SurA, partial [Pelagibacterales bacterium SAG-MED30]|nr:SurA [Pelagibacterales bacterium SAG-MED30]
ENKKLEVDFINLKDFYKKKNEFTNDDLKKFINENKDQLKIEYVDFNYAIINPKNLIGINEYNQSFFDKIDQIEVDISNEVQFNTIVSNLNITPVYITNFKFSSDKNKIEQKIFELKNNNFDIIEIDNNYILYKINKTELRIPDLNDERTKNEIIELISQKNKFDYNRNLLEKIRNKKFNNNDFLQMGENKIETIKLNSNRDNNKFEINAVKTLYSLPINSFTLINGEQNNIYLAKVIRAQIESINNNNDKLQEYKNKQNSNIKNNMLKTYDLYLNNKYDVVLNQKTIERVKNFYQ